MFTLKEIAKDELLKAFDKRFCGYCFRKKDWPEDLAVCKTTDQEYFISSNYKEVKGIAGWICSELLEPLLPGDIEVVEDNFSKFNRNFLLGLQDPDLYDTEEEKLAVAENFIEQIRELTK
jgi:hypothetical protein